MLEYLNLHVNPDDEQLISAIDELPLWSAPFGLKLLQTITMRSSCNILDIGCGTGFPLVELAQRFGKDSHVYGIDPWEKALERVHLKLRAFNISNATVQAGIAENLPFTDSFFDLIVSNNGLNNVQDLEKSIAECARVCKSGGEFTQTFNLAGSMMEFYNVFEEVLTQENLDDSVIKMKEHIYSKRRPVEEVVQILRKNNFIDIWVTEDILQLRYTDGSAMLNHSFISHWFLPSWKELVPEDMLEKVFTLVEEKLNDLAKKNREISLSIPFAVIDCKKG
jgi:ubiquinone/menaquinone biosynthesis C-methylase UbiE